MVKFINVSKVYKNGVRALNNINLEIPDNSTYGIIGLSGAGKSTLIRLINGLERPTEGQIIVDNRDISKFSKKQMQQFRKKTAMIFQNFNLFKSKNIFDNVAYGLTIEGRKKREIKDRVFEILKIVGIEDKKDMYPSQLSGGQKQRVAIARALITDPKILLLDEATSALDPSTSESILNLIAELKEKLSLTVILITHDMNVVKKICTDVAVIENGEIIENSKIHLMANHPYLNKLQNPLHLPKDLKITNTCLLRFVGDVLQRPVISQIIRDSNFDVNILLASIEYINKVPVGSLLVEVEEKNKKELKDYLNRNFKEVEIYETNS